MEIDLATHATLTEASPPEAVRIPYRKEAYVYLCRMLVRFAYRKRRKVQEVLLGAYLGWTTSPCLTIVGRSAFVYNDIHFRIVTTSLLFVVSLAASGARGGGFLRILRALSTFCATSDPFVTTR